LGSPTQTLVTRNKNAVGTSTTPVSTVGLTNNDIASVNINVYPNPSFSVVNFSTNRYDAHTILIYDITGKLVEQSVLVDGKSKLDVSAYNKGLYIYTLVSDSGKKLKSGKLTVGE
jgi:hypothetical protein